MSAILIISIFLLFVASYALLRTKRSPSNESSDYLPPELTPRGLFGETGAGDSSARSETADDAAKKASQESEKRLLERAALCDFEVLKDARATGKAALYNRALDALVENCASSAERLRSLAAYITHDEELRANSSLAARLLEAWEHELTRGSTVELLHVAALSDDAATFERALDAIMRAWEDGRLNVLSPSELRSLFDGEYWLLSSEAKSSGAGFALKQKLADARRRLAQGAPRENPPTAGELQTEASAQRERK